MSKLIASSSTFEGITKLIGQYYYTNVILLETSPGKYAIQNTTKCIPGVEVILKKGRYQFRRDVDR